ncbi:coiled-coil alpha-helical rod protein 1 isoform X2 [Melanotaenia boesemani]|uniref:coiled-coil alpha-helical rod protein 1 isoform X2 n=1 Tax=Melanotaenia boesemani TaxID=1250792 RepID=UPI001C049FD5|nr:coiled-coil alpha-helical rod protein 1 isoform X2 [Melanotaenia boesemani]
MERHNYGKERLIVPTDFTSPALSRNIQGDLVPPSHFASTVKSTGAHTVVQNPTSPPPISWLNPVLTSAPSGNPIPADPWLAITQAQQEILELRKENQRIMMLHRGNMRGKNSADHISDLMIRSTERSEQLSQQESDWWLVAEKHKTEAERLKGQVEALKETAGRYREEMREKDITLSRQNHELELIRKELSTAKTELSQIREELNLSSAQKEKITTQFEKLKAESVEETTKLKRVAEKSKEESRELALKAEMSRLQTEEEAKQQALRLSEQLDELKIKQEMQLQHLNTTHCAELDEARKTNSELQDRLQSLVSEGLQLKSTLIEVATERDGLKENLSQMGKAFETQSATLHSLRNYIGQLAPEKGEKERLNEAVEKLNEEKAALQMTTELLTVRLNSVNEILALQEEKIVKRALTDPLVKNGSEGLQVLQLWREKVFKLCVQLRSKDIEIRREKDKLLSEVSSTEQQLQQEQHRASVLQHSLHDRMAELDLEKVEKERLKQNLAKVHKENAELKSQNQKAEAEIKLLTEAVQRFSQEFQNKVAEVEAAKARLNTFTQRLSFAKRRVETIQGLVMRNVALQKVEQACKQAEQHNDSITNLKIEHSLVCEERDKLTQELKRTPELIEKALADLKEQYESKVRQQQQELEQCCMEVKLAVAGKEKADQSLQQIQIQLEESYVSLEGLRCELLRQQEHSEQALQERVSEIEDRCAEKLREMEVQVITARREHTKAVMTLQQFQKEARKQDMAKKIQHLESESAKHALNKQLKEKEKAMGTEKIEYPQAHTTLQNATTPGNQQKPLERKFSMETEAHSPTERLLSVLEELSTLSAAVVNSSEDSVEEDGWSDGVRPSDSLHS